MSKCVTYDEMSEHDKREYDKFEGFVRRRAPLPLETDQEAYAAIYGEVVFELPAPEPRR